MTRWTRLRTLTSVRDMKVTGHRGVSAAALENTMAAFREATRLGADGIEFDVQPTCDGELVVMHDAMVDRTTTTATTATTAIGSPAVFELSFEQIARLEAARRCPLSPLRAPCSR